MDDGSGSVRWSQLHYGSESVVQRCIDDLGRIVIPKEWRDELRFTAGEPVELRKNGRAVEVRRAVPVSARVIVLRAIEDSYELEDGRVLRRALKKALEELA